MEAPITYYLVNGEKIDYNEFEKLPVRPNLPRIDNYGDLKDLVMKSTSVGMRSEIIINTDDNAIILNLL